MLWQSHEKYTTTPPSQVKLHDITADAYAGLSKRQVLKWILGNENLRKFDVKFTNKAKPCPVPEKEIDEKQQMDLVDMKNIAVKYERTTY